MSIDQMPHLTGETMPHNDKISSEPGAILQWDEKEERRVLWKVDLLLMPVLTISYGLQFVRLLSILHGFIS